MDVPPIPGTVYRELVQYATVFKDSKEKNALSPLFEDIDDLIDLETKHDSFLERLYSKYIHAAVGPEKSLLDVDAQRLSVRPSEPAQTDESSTTATVDIAPTPACGHVFKRGEGIYRCRYVASVPISGFNLFSLGIAVQMKHVLCARVAFTVQSMKVMTSFFLSVPGQAVAAIVVTMKLGRSTI